MRALIIAAIALGLGLQDRSQDWRRDPSVLLSSVVTTKSYAYVLSPSRLVATDVDGMTMTPDGKFGILIGRTFPKITPQDILPTLTEPRSHPRSTPWFKIWDTKADTVREAPITLLRYFAEPGMFEIHWTSEPGIAIVKETGLPQVVTVEGQKVLQASTKLRLHRISLKEGTDKTILDLTDTTGAMGIDVSPTRPLILVQSLSWNQPIDPRDRKETIVTSAYDLNGALKRTGTSTVMGMAMLTDWTEDGKHMIGSIIRRGPQGTKPTSSPAVLNTDSCQVFETKEELKPYRAEPEKEDLELMESKSEAKIGETKHALRSLWLVSQEVTDDPRCFVAGDVGPMHWLTPERDLIAYVANGRLIVHDLYRMDLNDFLKAKAAAEKAIAMSKAKQVATGMLIYSADSDDFMPLKDGWQDSLMPYLKNGSVMDGFVYTYSGGSLTSLKDPASTEIGYVPIKGGRCVAYGDGHVVFRPGP